MLLPGSEWSVFRFYQLQLGCFLNYILKIIKIEKEKANEQLNEMVETGVRRDVRLLVRASRSYRTASKIGTQILAQVLLFRITNCCGCACTKGASDIETNISFTMKFAHSFCCLVCAILCV